VGAAPAARVVGAGAQVVLGAAGAPPGPALARAVVLVAAGPALAGAGVPGVPPGVVAGAGVPVVPVPGMPTPSERVAIRAAAAAAAAAVAVAREVRGWARGGPRPTVPA
jgi:hypothetical protein